MISLALLRPHRAAPLHAKNMYAWPQTEHIDKLNKILRERPLAIPYTLLKLVIAGGHESYANSVSLLPLSLGNIKRNHAAYAIGSHQMGTKMVPASRGNLPNTPRSRPRTLDQSLGT